MSQDLFGPATCFQNNSCVCEDFTNVVGFAQPINILTAFVIVLMGIFVFLKLKKYHYYTSLGYALGLIVVGLSAIYLHIRMDYLGQILDFTAVTVSIILLEIIAKFKWDSIYVTLGLFCVIFILNLFLPDYRVAISAISIFYFPYVNIVVRGNWKKIRTLVLFFVLGLSLWYLDDKHWLCSKTSFLQLHAIWHVIVAVLSYYNALYYFKYVFPKGHN